MGICRCPYTDIASFVYRYSKGDRSKKILETGSGDGNNLWYLKKEGFDVCGIELNEERIKNSKLRLSEDGLEVEIKQGSFTEIDYEDNLFDLVFDRGAITCVNYEDAKKTVDEIHRVLKKEGYFYFNPYTQGDGNFVKGSFLSDERVTINRSELGKYEGINYYSIKDVFKLFDENSCNIIEFNSITKREIISSRNLNTETFEVIVQKIN